MTVQDMSAFAARGAPVRGSAIEPAYLSGFGNSFETEALPGALPVGMNSPQKVNYGLYAEQLSGSPFTAPQATNQRSWLYRIRASVRHTGRFERIADGLIRTAFGTIEIEPGEVCVIPRGVIFRVEPTGAPARAYVCENYGGSFTLPDR